MFALFILNRCDVGTIFLPLSYISGVSIVSMLLVFSVEYFDMLNDLVGLDVWWMCWDGWFVLILVAIVSKLSWFVINPWTLFDLAVEILWHSAGRREKFWFSMFEMMLIAEFYFWCSNLQNIIYQKFLDSNNRIITPGIKLTFNAHMVWPPPQTFFSLDKKQRR